MALSEEEILRRLIAGYLGAAARDIKAAEAIAATGDDDLASTFAYHVRQAAEKIAKAVFVARGPTVTKEHRLAQNIDAPLTADPADPCARKLKPLEKYDRYATTTRYPSTLGRLAARPARDGLADDVGRVRQLTDGARAELMAGLSQE